MEQPELETSDLKCEGIIYYMFMGQFLLAEENLNALFDTVVWFLTLVMKYTGQDVHKD